MKDTLPISAHILTWNSEKTVRAALESVRHCAEILVIDGGSTDDTLAIANEFGAIIVPQRDVSEQGKPLEHYSKARNRGLQYATQPWILSQDSDEYASPELMTELRKITESHTAPAAYYVPRRYVLVDKSIVMQASTYPNERMYFFHKDAVSEWIKPVHERPELKDDIPVRRLKGASLAPLGTIEDFKRKNERYIIIEMKKSEGSTMKNWLYHRLYRTVRSRLIASIRLLRIWLVPGGGKRLPLKHELIRFWYGWKLIVSTYPKKSL